MLMERPTCNHSCSGSSRLLEKIRKVDFALAETILYLDVYPHCAEALSYYHKLIEERDALLFEYQKNSPVTAYGVTSEHEWSWISSPWPWHYDAN